MRNANYLSLQRASHFEQIEGLLSQHCPELKICDHKFVGSYDNDIYILTLKEPVVKAGRKFSKVVVRMPTQSPSTRPSQHNPLHQSWVLEQCQDFGIPVPVSIYCSVSDDFLVESCVDGTEAFKLEIDQCLSSYKEMGSHLRKIHQVKTERFGTFGAVPGAGTHDTWYSYLEIFALKRLDVIESSNTWTAQFCDRIRKVVTGHKDYLVTFDKPCLVHGDMNASNVFLIEVDGVLKVSGIVDFADSMSADPLYDLGAFFIEIPKKGSCRLEWVDMDEFLSGYGSLAPQQVELVQMYSLMLCIYYLCEDFEVRPKRVESHTVLATSLLAMLNA